VFLFAVLLFGRFGLNLGHPQAFGHQGTGHRGFTVTNLAVGAGPAALFDFNFNPIGEGGFVAAFF
jgi:hypothetical protein